MNNFLGLHPVGDATCHGRNLMQRTCPSATFAQGFVTSCANENGPLEAARSFEGFGDQATATGIFPILACHSFGPVSCTEVPCESTATVTGMSLISNS